tara:strand:+ start:6065 stop:8842 length:2778 start_codon:yes stop_codon:yes gene_type:complete
MAKYPTITDSTAENWNLPSSDGDASMDVFVFNKNSGGEIAYVIFIIKNAAIAGSNTFLEVSSINFSNINVDNGLAISPSDGGNQELGDDTTQGDKLIAPTTNISSVSYSGANRVLHVPATGDVTLSDLGDTNNSRVIPIYASSYITAGGGETNPIPDNSYAAFIVSFEPFEVVGRNTTTSLDISTSVGSFSVPLSVASFNSFDFGYSYGDFNSATGVLSNNSTPGSLTKSITSADFSSVDLGLIPVGSYVNEGNETVEADLDKTFVFYDLSTQASEYSFGASASPSWFAPADTFLESTLLSKSLSDGSSYALNEINSVDLQSTYESDTHIYSKFKLTQSAKSQSTKNLIDGYVSNITRSRADNTKVKYLVNLLAVPDDSASDGAYGVGVTYGVYDRITVPSKYSDFSGYYNQEIEDGSVVPQIAKTSTAAKSLYFGEYFYIDFMLTYSNFGQGALNTSYAFPNLDIPNELYTYSSAWQAVTGLGYLTKYVELTTNTYDSTLHSQLDSGTSIGTLSNHWNSDSNLTDYQRSLGIRAKLITNPSYEELYKDNTETYGEYNVIDTIIDVDSLEQRFGKYPCRIVHSSSTIGPATKLIHNLPKSQVYKVLCYPKYTEITFANSTTTNVSPHVLIDSGSDDGTSSIHTASNWYVVGATTEILNTSANWDVGNRYIGSSGAYRTGHLGSSTGLTHDNDQLYILDQQGAAIKEFTPSSLYYKTTAKLNSSSNKWEAFLDFTFGNSGSNNIYVYDVEVIDAPMLPSASTAASSNGEDLWYIGNGVGGSSSFTTTKHQFKVSTSEGSTLQNTFTDEKDRFNCCIPADNYIPNGTDKINNGSFSVRFVGTMNGNDVGDYYKSVRVKYYKDIYGNRTQVNSNNTTQPVDFENARKHEAIMLVKVVVIPGAELQIGDADTTAVVNGSPIVVPVLSIG